MSEKRLIGDYPVIGIRPIIDARKGILDVRGSLEGQTMAMAQAAKQLLETNLKYTDGSPVRVIIADQTIGRVAESAACAEKFKKEGADITLSVTPCWCNPSVSISHPKPLLEAPRSILLQSVPPDRSLLLCSAGSWS